MRSRITYLLFFLSILAFPQIANAGNAASSAQKDAVIQHAGVHLDSAVYPQSKAVFYGYQIPAEKRVQTQNRLSETGGSDEEEHSGILYETAGKSVNQKSYSEFISRRNQIPSSQNVYTLLYPFHFHL